MIEVSKQVLKKGFKFGAFEGSKFDVIEKFIDFHKLQLPFEFKGFLALKDFLFCSDVFAGGDDVAHFAFVLLGGEFKESFSGILFAVWLEFGFGGFPGFFSDFVFIGFIDEELKLIWIRLFDEGDVLNLKGSNLIFVIVFEGEFDLKELIFVFGNFEIKGVSIGERDELVFMVFDFADDFDSLKFFEQEFGLDAFADVFEGFEKGRFVKFTEREFRVRVVTVLAGVAALQVGWGGFAFGFEFPLFDFGAKVIRVGKYLNVDGLMRRDGVFVLFGQSDNMIFGKVVRKGLENDGERHVEKLVVFHAGRYGKWVVFFIMFCL